MRRSSKIQSGPKAGRGSARSTQPASAVGRRTGPKPAALKPSGPKPTGLLPKTAPAKPKRIKAPKADRRPEQDPNAPFFVKSAPSLDLCPPADRVEYAFIGRSNVGKSSLINMLIGRALAQTSGTPGKTRLINYFSVRGQYWVDLPGYGYAKVSKTNRAVFQEMISTFLTGRKEIKCIMVLIDARHLPQPIDVEFFAFLAQAGLPHALVLTKADKLGPVALQKQVTDYLNALLERLPGLPPYFVTSAEKNLGKEELLKFLEEE